MRGIVFFGVLVVPTMVMSILYNSPIWTGFSGNQEMLARYQDVRLFSQSIALHVAVLKVVW